MIKLKNVILQMKEEDYNSLSSQLKKSNADKFLTLLMLLRENQASEEEIAIKLNVNANAYYTLKSRLYNKIQEFLMDALSGSKADLLKSVANIPNLIFDSPRDTALAILAKLEKELIDYDMPYELSNVYNALKKLHINSSKYYEYTQLYNKHVAYTIALDKAEDLLANFNKTLAEFYSSRDKSKLELLSLIKKEMANVCRLYDSHHLTVYKNIVNISYALFVVFPEAVEEDEPVEDMLAEIEEVFKAYPKDVTYQYLNNVLNFLSFEYYHNLKLYKKEAQYFDAINSLIPTFMHYNFCSFPAKFLISKIERYIYLKKETELYDENKQLITQYEPDKSDIPNYINFVKYLAAGMFYSQKYNEAVTILNNLLSEISFKNFPHSEIEIKLFLSLAYSMTNKYDTAHNLLRSAARKIRELNEDSEYENANTFIKIIHTQMDSGKESEEKLIKLKHKFDFHNKGTGKMLEFLDLSGEFIKILSKSIK